MFIRSCVFHYELELIHSFVNGNGRIGRLWLQYCFLIGIQPLPGFL